MKRQDAPDAAPAPFAGFSSPNYTPVPDELFDDLLPLLSGAEVKVLLYIVRRTFGFKRESDAISLSQMAGGIMTRDGKRLDGGTGLSRPTLITALKSLEQRGVIIAEHRMSLRIGHETTVYHLAVAAPGTPDSAPEPPPPSQEMQPPLVKKFNHPGKVSEPPLVKKFNPQETVGETVLGETVGNVPTPTHVGVGADAPPPAQKQRRATKAPKPPKDEERTPAQREDTRLLAEAWMTANAIDAGVALAATVVQYNAWAHAALKNRDRTTLTRFLRWMYTKRRHEGAQFTITPTIVDQRIGQWLELPGAPEHYTSPDRNAAKTPPRFVPSMIPVRPKTKEEQEWDALVAARDAKRAAEAQATGGVP